MNFITVLSFSLGQLQTNCYFLIQNNKCLIIDPGDSAQFILDKLLELKLTPVAIVATHGHFDHIMAVGEIQLSFDIPFYIHKNDLFLLDRIESSAKYYLDDVPPIIKPKNIKNLENKSFTFYALPFTLIPTPGHTPGSVCFYSAQSAPPLAGSAKSAKTKTDKADNADSADTPVLFSGDTLFKSGIGRYDFSYSSKSDLMKSLQKLFKLPPKTIVYPGHGEKTTVGEEKENKLI